MKRVVTSVFMSAAATAALAQPSAGASWGEHLSCTGAPNEVRVTVRGVKESIGLVTVELYRNDEATFLTKEGRELRKQFAARAPATHICLHAPKSDSYAVAVYHDENANSRFDKTGLGLPAEPYGVSNNPRMRFGPPKIAEALFDVAESGAAVEITLNN